MGMFSIQENTRSNDDRDTIYMGQCHLGHVHFGMFILGIWMAKVGNIHVYNGCCVVVYIGTVS